MVNGCKDQWGGADPSGYAIRPEPLGGGGSVLH